MNDSAILSASLKAIAAMTAGAALLVANDAALKHLTYGYPVGQVICLRQAAMLLMIVPYIMIVSGWPASGAGRVICPGQCVCEYRSASLAVQ